MPTPLNGLEIREALIANVAEAFDRIPMMGEGNSYHGLDASIAVSFKAFPADCPVPPATEVGPLRFTYKEVEWQKEVSVATGNIEKLKALRDKIDKLLAPVVVEHSEFISVDGSKPDEVRDGLGLPLPDAVRPNPINLGI